MIASSDDLLQVDRILTSINRQLDAMYVKLGKIVVAAETVNEVLGEFPSREQLDRLLAIATQRPSGGVAGFEQPPGDHADSGN